MIRQAKAEDVSTLCTLLYQLGYASELTQVEQVLANNDKDSGVYVYEYFSKVVGFISVIRFFYFPTMQYMTRITAICVDEQHRDLGIGRQLLSFVEELATDFGNGSIEATCSMQRKQTHQFYLQNGYSKHSYKFAKLLKS